MPFCLSPCKNYFVERSVLCEAHYKSFEDEKHAKSKEYDYSQLTCFVYNCENTGLMMECSDKIMRRVCEHHGKAVDHLRDVIRKCNTENCDNDRFGSRDLCYNHEPGCTITGCKNIIKFKGLHCHKHSCEHCTNPLPCNKHTCAMMGCHKVTVQKYCTRHVNRIIHMCLKKCESVGCTRAALFCNSESVLKRRTRCSLHLNKNNHHFQISHFICWRMGCENLICLSNIKAEYPKCSKHIGKLDLNI